MWGSVNAGTKVQTRTGRVRKAVRAMGARRGRLSAPWLQFHGVDRADVYIIIRVRACCCGECALNPPTSQPIPRRRPSLAPAQRHALPEHFRSPTQPRRSPTQSQRTPAGCAMHSPPKAFARPRTATHPPRALPLPHAAPTHARRPHNSLPAAQSCLSFRSASGTKKRHRTVHVRCRMSRSTVVAVGHLGW